MLDYPISRLTPLLITVDGGNQCDCPIKGYYGDTVTVLTVTVLLTLPPVNKLVPRGIR